MYSSPLSIFFFRRVDDVILSKENERKMGIECEKPIIDESKVNNSNCDIRALNNRAFASLNFVSSPVSTYENYGILQYWLVSGIIEILSIREKIIIEMVVLV